jgi:hypothetical protein
MTTEEGTAFFTTIIEIGDAFYWIEVPSANPTPAQIRELARQPSKRHGPFDTEAECNANLALTLFGPDVTVVDGGVWPSGSDVKH